MPKSLTVKTNQLSTHSAWARGPPQNAAASSSSSPRSQSPVTTPTTLGHQRKPSGLSAVSNAAVAVRPGLNVTSFGSIPVTPATPASSAHSVSRTALMATTSIATYTPAPSTPGIPIGFLEVVIPISTILTRRAASHGCTVGAARCGISLHATAAARRTACVSSDFGYSSGVVYPATADGEPRSTDPDVAARAVLRASHHAATGWQRHSGNEPVRRTNSVSLEGERDADIDARRDQL
ncbi:hypothetical protein EXIGLDRAFT_832079 [Exidia glandulosa HHB12029]|uniref:Uncharacterized protein n=1 Tax=Exidia glandulosa HHB12029 TaxID=1314781 RepID=A0A165M2U6_EXIGL|nr:hypothetical protein EXIGLDRAFT_832079 [Exidia glandulosa HHB12029]